MMVFCLGLRKGMYLLVEDRFCLGSNAGEGIQDLEYMASSHEGHARSSCPFSFQVASI